MQEKSQTPAHLKVLADRFGRLEHKKLILSNYNSRIDVPCGESITIKFFMPSKVNDKAGSISQEYDLIISPPARIEVGNGEQSDARIIDAKTYVTVCCNGVNTNVLGLYKKLNNFAYKGDRFIQMVSTAQRCTDMVWEFADQAVGHVVDEAQRQ